MIMRVALCFCSVMCFHPKATCTKHGKIMFDPISLPSPSHDEHPFNETNLHDVKIDFIEWVFV